MSHTPKTRFCTSFCRLSLLILYTFVGHVAKLCYLYKLSPFALQLTCSHIIWKSIWNYQNLKVFLSIDMQFSCTFMWLNSFPLLIVATLHRNLFQFLVRRPFSCVFKQSFANTKSETNFITCLGHQTSGWWCRMLCKSYGGHNELVTKL